MQRNVNIHYVGTFLKCDSIEMYEIIFTHYYEYKYRSSHIHRYIFVLSVYGIFKFCTLMDGKYVTISAIIT